jgi:DNA (cytosine-5)-methyltransferase 1
MKPTIYWIDLFCGAGGTSTGIHFSGTNSKVLACVNHDANAIRSHAENHPETHHFTEDIRDFKVVEKIAELVKEVRAKDDNSIIAIWASLECTNFSKAKGGQPRDADSRTLAEHMFMYLDEINPEYFWVENVREFMAWGELDDNGKPVSRKAGTDYLRWTDNVKSRGYRFDYRILNSANYGAVQARERYFAQFAKNDLPIDWPEQTHAKVPGVGSLFPTKKWRAVKEVLDLENEGKSIFDRKKPLSENTLKRILAGLNKFAGNDFIKKYYSGNDAGKCISLDGPCGTIKTKDGHAVVRSTHMNTYYGNGGVHSVDEPSPTVTTKDRISKVDAQFIVSSYSKGGLSSLDSPNPAVMTVPKQNLVSAQWLMDTNFKNVGRGIEEPAPTVVACRKHHYLINANSSTSPVKDVNDPSPTITSARTHFIVNPQWFNQSPKGVDEPSPTLIARMDKSPLSVVAVVDGALVISVFEDDSPTMVKIKEFMAEHLISDIKMRMLTIPELKQIQGFPKDYKLIGTQTEQKKYIGNAVEVTMAKALVAANFRAIENYFKQKAA